MNGTMRLAICTNLCECDDLSKVCCTYVTACFQNNGRNNVYMEKCDAVSLEKHESK